METLLERTAKTLSERQTEESNMSWEQVPFPVLSDAQFLQWQALLEDRTGMYVAYYHRSLLQSNLIIRMREINCSDFDQYYAKVCSKPGGIVEWSTLLDRLMVQETRFYRNPESLVLFNEFLKNKLDKNESQQAIHIWSVGCSSGEEPYTLAMLCNEVLLAKKSSRTFGITATDISLPVLSKAREGIYNSRRLLDMNHELVSQYFEQLNQDLFRVRSVIKQKVCFSMANMIDIEKSPLRNMDAIYCQNVLIYFRKERKHIILDCLVERLAPGGLLVIGQGEAVDWHNPLVRRVEDNQTLAFIRHNN
jgi:chemotaxis protein methyltransferase CheR/type IV pilus assembly protein PilK